MKAEEAAQRLTLGEYLYRGFVIFDRGAGRSVHASAFRNSYSRWRVVRKTGSGYFDRESTNYDSPTLRDAKARIDRALAQEVASPCPFDGGEAALNDVGGHLRHQVLCKKCGAGSARFALAALAFAAWNRRAA